MRDGSTLEHLLDGLDPSQRDAVRCEHVPLAIVAGPGSGKTRVLTRRIAWRVATGAADTDRVLALTFTRHAAAELTRRLDALGVTRPSREQGVTAGTLHSVALAQLRSRAARRDRAMPALLERKVRVLLKIVGARGAEALALAADLAGEIEWAKARLLAPDVYPAAAELAGRAPMRGTAFVAEAYEAYEREKRRARLVDFDDLLWWCGDALETDEEFAAQQRFRFRHVFVDEFQDVSPAQLRLVRGWLGDRADLTVVGDPDQAIFSFAGADPTGLTRFARTFPGAQVVRLEHNYRSTRPIVVAAEALLADGGGRRPARRAAKGDGPVPRVTAYEDDDDEAEGVAARLRTAHAEGRPWSACAVLYRTNAQSAAFEAAFGAAGIPYRVRGDARFLDRPEVRAALDALRAGSERAPGAALEHHLTDLELGTDPADASRQHAAAVTRLGREYLAAEPGGSLDGFLAWLPTVLRNEAPPSDADGVELVTFHRAKGLEFRTVFVTGLERGLVPIARADTPAERAEERRLLYVALTRAEEHLELSWARRRTLGSRVVGRAPSPWLAPVESALDPPAAVSPTRAARSGLDAARDHLASSTSEEAANPDVLAALVEWRRGLARASSVPAFVIFHDATLRTIAEVLPATRAALLDVPGIGPVKIERYADAVLAIVRAHAPRASTVPA
ncbi:MAG TPA: ATP-dependent DNA helicase UvrD2 [Acidimicrobiia bacterium]|jgi:DNA helicase-2/ATP-dependent DNA helicase PcrA